ncbi:hypothetical protein [Massilia horti]|nr:hypothetical protein [Massilia horti]
MTRKYFFREWVVNLGILFLGISILVLATAAAALVAEIYPQIGFAGETGPPQHLIDSSVVAFSHPKDNQRRGHEMNEISEKRLLEIESRANRATPAPWKSYVEGRDHTSGTSFIMTGTPEQRGGDIELSGATVADQDFIASARQDVVDLVNEVRRLRAMQNKV